MQQAKALTKQITSCQAEVVRLEGERERCNAAIAAGEQHATALENLRGRRADEVAKAFVEHREPSVAALDKELSATQKIHDSAGAQATAARDAVRIIEQRIAEQRSELARARTALRSIVDEEINRRGAAARESFNEAVSVLRDKLAEVSALDSMAATLRGTVNRYSGSQLMINALRDEGLKIFTPKGPWAPGWLHTFSAASNYESLATEFRAMGLDI